MKQKRVGFKVGKCLLRFLLYAKLRWRHILAKYLYPPPGDPGVHILECHVYGILEGEPGINFHKFIHSLFVHLYTFPGSPSSAFHIPNRALLQNAQKGIGNVDLS